MTRGLGERLVLDELFDLSLYRALRKMATGRLAETLDQLIPVETRHLAFWQAFFDLPPRRLDLGRRVKLGLVIAGCWIFRAPAIHLALEAIEVHGVRKYLEVWRGHGDGPLAPAVREILEEEFAHEDAVVSAAAERRISPERVRNVFLGLNDGLVEILGAISGFFGAFGDPETVLIAGLTVAVAGGLSMAAGAYIAASSEAEVRSVEAARRRFLGQAAADAAPGESPLGAAALVGMSYLAGALVPVLPVLAGARTPLPTILTAGTVVVAVSAIVAFLSGMELRRRVLVNLAITAAAAIVTYGIGVAVTAIWGIST
jgi:VIT1/CCC1 family predicted Fe2+/Mn2+ transporter